MSELGGQTIVITGGETGIGRAAVLQLAAEGTHVLIGGILSDEADVTLRAAEGLPVRWRFKRRMCEMRLRSTRSSMRLLRSMVASTGWFATPAFSTVSQAASTPLTAYGIR